MIPRRIISAVSFFFFQCKDFFNHIFINYHIDTAINTTRSYGIKSDGANEHVANLGVNILLGLFKYHDVVRGEILEQITSRIVSRSDSAKDFLRLLESIIKEYPDAVESYLTNVKQKDTKVLNQQ